MNNWGRRGLRLVVASLVCFLALLAAPALAHTELEGTDPAADSLLTELPPAVTLTFSELVTTPPDPVRVFAPDGSRVDEGAAIHPDDDPARVQVALRPGHATPGTYLVVWRVVSDDSHPVSGSFSFSVGTTSPTPGAGAEVRTDRTVALLLGITRWLGYAGTCLLLGCAAAVQWCRPRSGWSGRGPRLVTTGALLLAGATVASLLLKGPYDAGRGLGHLTDPDLLLEVLGSTYGRSLLARLALALAALAWLEWGRPVGRPAVALGVGGGLALATTFALAGHAAVSSHRTVTVAVDVVHVTCMAVWLGGLVLLSTVVLAERDEAAVAVVRRFSRIAQVAVAVLVATGTIQALRQVGSFAALEDTTYGKVLTAKLACVAAALAVAFCSRLWLMRRIKNELEPFAWIRTTVLAEALIGLVILGITSGLVATEPARTAHHEAAPDHLVGIPHAP